MLQDYKKRFVRITVTLVGSVLLLALLALGIYLAVRAKNELKLTMSQVVDPISFFEDFRSEDGSSIFDEFERLNPGEAPGGQAAPPEGEAPDSGMPEGEAPEGGSMPENEGHFPPGPGGNGGPGRRGLIDDENRRITVIVAEPSDGSYSMISSESSIESERIAEAVPLVIAEEENFGTLASERLIFYKDLRGTTLRIALTDSLAYYGEILKYSLILLGIFVAALGLFLLISIRLASYAARPMEDAMERERTFVADISHDLKTPITIIKANNSILRSSPEASVASQTQWLDGTDAATDNMLGIINEMLTLSQLEGEEPVVRKERVNLSEAAEGAVLTMEAVAFERGISLTDEIADDVFVEADPDLVSRILSGLLENALKYEPEGGSVEVRLERGKKNALLTVRNRSSVIPAEDLPHVFDRFYRADKTRGEKKGHGLGLSIVKRSAELSGGEISVSSREGEGTSFTVKFETV